MVSGAAVGALDPPGRVRRDLDPRLADDVAELPFRAPAVVLDVEFGRQAEVALAARCEADVGADARDPERPNVVALEVMADHVPRPVLGQQRERVEGPFLFLVAVDRPVPELHGALLRDRSLELAQPALQLGRVVGIANLDTRRRCRSGRRRASPPSRPSARVLERRGAGAAPRLRENPPQAGRSRCWSAADLPSSSGLELRQEVKSTSGRERVRASAPVELVALQVERDASGEGELAAVGSSRSREARGWPRRSSLIYTPSTFEFDVSRREQNSTVSTIRTRPVGASAGTGFLSAHGSAGESPACPRRATPTDGAACGKAADLAARPRGAHADGR